MMQSPWGKGQLVVTRRCLYHRCQSSATLAAFLPPCVCLSKSHNVISSLPIGCTVMKKTLSHGKVCCCRGSRVFWGLTYILFLIFTNSLTWFQELDWLNKVEETNSFFFSFFITFFLKMKQNKTKKNQISRRIFILSMSPVWMLLVLILLRFIFFFLFKSRWEEPVWSHIAENPNSGHGITCLSLQYWSDGQADLSGWRPAWFMDWVQLQLRPPFQQTTTTTKKPHHQQKNKHDLNFIIVFP